MFYWDILVTRSTDITVSRAGSQLKMIEHPMLGNVFKHKIVTKRCQDKCTHEWSSSPDRMLRYMPQKDNRYIFAKK